MLVAEATYECEGEHHLMHTPSANVWNNQACKEHAGAETNGVFLAVMLFRQRDAWRARQPSQCAERF